MIIGSGEIVLGATRMWDYVVDFENVHCPAVPSVEERLRIGDSGKVVLTTRRTSLVRAEVLAIEGHVDLAVSSCRQYFVPEYPSYSIFETRGRK